MQQCRRLRRKQVGKAGIEPFELPEMRGVKVAFVCCQPDLGLQSLPDQETGSIRGCGIGLRKSAYVIVCRQSEVLLADPVLFGQLTAE